jgi:hypothetical protein
MKKMKHILKFQLMLAATICFFVAPSLHASPTYKYNFTSVTDNDPLNAAIGESQLLMDVIDAGNNRVIFNFSNHGPAASAITDVYFEDGTLLGIASIDDVDPAVSFSQLAQFTDVPTAISTADNFHVTVGFTSDFGDSVYSAGVNPGESIAVAFDLKPRKNFDNVLDDLGSQSLRIAVQMKGFASGGKEALINKSFSIPSPDAMVLASIGAGLVIYLRRRKPALL